MKTPTFNILLLGLLIGLIISLLTIRVLDTEIDLPEEHSLISRDENKPTQLIGWYDKNNILHIGFKHQ